MRILIISSGLRPERFGGLPSHVEDLVRALAETGKEVAYLNVGAKSKWPKTSVWKRNDLPCPAWNLSSEFSYSQYWTGTIRPLSQIRVTPAYRRAFSSIVAEFRPDIVHIHELTSFPLAMIDELRQKAIKTIFSAADFYVLCPTSKLFRPDHSFCDKTPEQLDCHNCSKEARCARAIQWNYANDQWLNRLVP